MLQKKCAYEYRALDLTSACTRKPRSRGLVCSLGMTQTHVFNTYQIHVYCDEKLINLRLINKTFRTRTTFRVGCSETGEGCV